MSQNVKYKLFYLHVPHLQKNSCKNLSVPAPSFSMNVDCSWSSNSAGNSSLDITPKNIYINYNKFLQHINIQLSAIMQFKS